MTNPATCARSGCSDPVTTSGAKYCSRSCANKARAAKQKKTAYATSYEAGESPTACPECGSSESTVQGKRTLGVVVRRYRQCKDCGADWQSRVIQDEKPSRCPRCHQVMP